MKRYYSTLDKSKKEKVKERYKKEYKNSDLNTRLTRLLIYSIIGYIGSIVIFIEALIREENKVGSILIAVILFIASTVFLIGRTMIKLNVLNKIALKNK